MTSDAPAAQRSIVLTEAAPAKINLALHVTGKRDDGYHLLDSLVVFADVGERLRVRPAPPGTGIALEIEGPFAGDLPAGPDNLVVRAAAGLAASTGRAPDLALDLTKTLPVASGVGGGSADAAATLRALCRFWSLPLQDARVRADCLALAGRLGADVPACLDSRPVRMGGVGDLLRPAPVLPALAVLLVNPGIAVSTPAVFAARQQAFSKALALADGYDSAAALAADLTAARNDLQGPAMALAPEIGAVLAAIGALPGCRLARMSGSGATCFGLFDRLEEAWAAAEALATQAPRWWLTAAPVAPASGISAAA